MGKSLSRFQLRQMAAQRLRSDPTQGIRHNVDSLQQAHKPTSRRNIFSLAARELLDMVKAETLFANSSHRLEKPDTESLLGATRWIKTSPVGIAIVTTMLALGEETEASAQLVLPLKAKEGEPVEELAYRSKQTFVWDDRYGTFVEAVRRVVDGRILIQGPYWKDQERLPPKGYRSIMWQLRRGGRGNWVTLPSQDAKNYLLAQNDQVRFVLVRYNPRLVR